MRPPPLDVRLTHEPGSSPDPRLRRWDAVVELEDLLGAFQLRNPADVRPMPGLLGPALRRLLAAARAERAPPRNLVVDLAERLGPHLTGIVESPRARLQRERRMVPMEQLRHQDPRCRRWYARQPGRTAAEKASRGGRLLGLVRRHSLDTTENRVLVAVARRLEPRAARYLRRYGEHQDHPHREAVRRLRATLRRILAAEELGALPPPQRPVRPTNALLKDVHYRAVWDTWVALAWEEQRADALWDGQAEALRRARACAVLARIAERMGGHVVEAACLLPPPGERDGAMHRWPPVVARAGGRAVEIAVRAGRAERDEVVLSSEDRGSVVLPLPRLGPGALLDSPRLRLADAVDCVDAWLEGLEPPLTPPSWQPSAPSGPERSVCMAVAPAATWSSAAWGVGPDATAVAAPPSLITDGSEPESGPAWPCALPAWGPAIGARVRDGATLWEALEGGEAVGTALLPAGPSWADSAVMVLPDDASPLAFARLEVAAPSASSRWFVPRSVALACLAETRGVLPELEADAEAVGVLVVGGPRSTFAVLQRRRGDCRSEWCRCAGEVASISATPSAWIDAVLTAADIQPTDEARISLLASPQAVEALLGELDATVELPVSGSWRTVVLPARAAAEAARSLARELVAELVTSGGGALPSSWAGKPGYFLVGGWIVESRTFRLALMEAWPAAGATIAFLGGRAALAEAGLEVAQRLAAHEPAWVERLPRIQVLGQGLGDRIQGQDLVTPREHRPGDPPVRATVREFGRVPAGVPFDIALPIQIEGRPDRSRVAWREADLVLDEPLTFDVELHWDVGRSGLRIHFHPGPNGSGVRPRALDWEALGANEASVVRNQFPRAIARQPWVESDLHEVLGLLDDAARTLSRRDDVGDRPGVLVGLCEALGRVLPCPERTAVDPALQGSQDLGRAGDAIDDLLGLMLSGAGGKGRGRKASRKRGWTARLDLTGAERKALKARTRAAVRLVGLTLQPGSWAGTVASWVDALSKDAERRARGRSAPTLDDSSLVVARLHAAGRLASTHEGDVVLHALIRSGHALTACVEARKAWIWAVATALLAGEGAARSLDEADIDTLTGDVLALGDHVSQDGCDDQTLAEVGLALLGLTRIREGRADRYGPATQWSLGVSLRVDRWLGDFPEAAEGREMRFRLPGGRALWPALLAVLDGTQDVYLEAMT